MTFYFYDLETTGINPREARVMQFAGQRTDMDLNPIDEPHDILIKLSEDVVPDPDAILVTGITPQKTLADGITEAEFLRIFHQEVATPGTIFVGYNTVRFDDEFVRYMHYRNFYDPYEWQYLDRKSRWDLLDVVRMTRALRPDGIKWPVDDTGKPTNRLELITKLNGIDHYAAHDALSDVRASIAVAKLIKDMQPKLFEYLLNIRDKKAVAALVEGGQPFVYSSGMYAAEFEKTSVACLLAANPKRQGVFVYDLRHDPEAFIDMTPQELAKCWTRRHNEEGLRLPVKSLQYNRCPAVAPMAVLDAASQKRLGLDMSVVKKHLQVLNASSLPETILQAWEIVDKEQQKRFASAADSEVDARLYDGFIGDADKTKMSVVRAASPTELASLEVVFKDERLRGLLPLYKARNFPATLSDEERAEWEHFRERKLLGGKQASRLARYFNRLAELAATELPPEKQFLLEELQLYGQSIMPVAEDY